MLSYPEQHIVTNAEQLSSLLDQVAPASLLKEVPFIHPHYRAMIEASPFAILATSGPNGLDASPRASAARCIRQDPLLGESSPVF